MREAPDLTGKKKVAPDIVQENRENPKLTQLYAEIERLSSRLTATENRLAEVQSRPIPKPAPPVIVERVKEVTAPAIDNTPPLLKKINEVDDRVTQLAEFLSRTPRGNPKPQLSSWTALTGWLPHGAFSDSTNQTSGGLTSENLITFNTDEHKDGITHSTTVNPSRIYINQKGRYLIIFSIVVVASAPNKTAVFWFKEDGVNIPRSGTYYEMPISGENLCTVSFVEDFNVGQYFEIAWASRNDASMILKSTAADVNPTTPASPCVILTVNMIST